MLPAMRWSARDYAAFISFVFLAILIWDWVRLH